MMGWNVKSQEFWLNRNGILGIHLQLNGKENFNLTEKKGKENFPLDEQNREFQLNGSGNFFTSVERNAKFKRKQEKSRYFHIKGGENKIFYSQWKIKIHREKNVLKSEFTRLKDVF